MKKQLKHIPVKEEIFWKLMEFKLTFRAKDWNEVIKKLIEKWK